MYIYKSCLFLKAAFCLLLYSCSHNATSPEEKIIHQTIHQDISTINIPIDIANERVAQLVKNNAPNPLAEDNTTVKIPVFNFLTVPQTVIHKVIVKEVCDVATQVKIKDGLKCVVCPPCCMAVVVIKGMCDVEREVQSLINTQIINKINVDAPVYYKVMLNNIHIDGNTDVIHMHLTLDIKLKADIDLKLFKTGVASCGMNEEMPQIELTLSSKIGLGDDGRFILSNKTWETKWNKPCNLTALDIKAEDLLNLPIIKQRVEKKMDELVQDKVPNDINLNDKLAKVWPKITQPIKIGDYGYINLNITSLHPDNLFVSVNKITTAVGAICKPTFFLKNAQIDSSQTAFPKLSKGLNKPGFNITLLGVSKLEDINNYAEQAFDKYIKKAENNILKFNNIRLFQSNKNLAIEVALSKPFKGKVYLFGKPKFDSLNNTLLLDSLEYTTESKIIIDKFANWLLHTKVVEETIKEKFQYKYEKNINQAIQQLTNINKEISNNIFLKGSLTKINPTSIFLSDNNINVMVNVAGDAFIEVR